MPLYRLIKVSDRTAYDGDFASDDDALRGFGERIGDTLTLYGDGAASYLLGSGSAAPSVPVYSKVADDAIRSVTG